MKKLIIIGASGHGKVIANIAKLNGYTDITFLDDDLSKKKNGKYDVIGTSSDIDKYRNVDTDFFVGIGNNAIRKKMTEILLEKEIHQPILIHPSAVIDETASIEEGTAVMANVVINADARIGKYCIINTATTVDHDCIIHDYVHLSPGVHVAGTVEIGKSCWIGIGASIINNITICKDCVVGAGSVVIKNVEETGIYVGVPVKKLIR